MVEGDIFREVEEDLRREQWMRLWKKYGTAIIAGAALIIVFAAGYNIWTWWEAKRAAQGGAAFINALDLGEDGKTAEMTAALNKIAGEQPRGYATLAKLRIAAATAESGKIDEASAQYEAVANDAFADTLLRDYAQIQWAALNLDRVDEATIRKHLDPLNVPGNSWRHSARELIGLAAYKAGKTDEAAQIFQEISLDPQTPSELSKRAQTMLAILTKTPKPQQAK